MKGDNSNLFFYSTSLDTLCSESVRGYHVFLLCRHGEGTFWIHGCQHRLKANHVAVFTRPDKVNRVKSHDDLDVALVGIAQWFLHTLLPHDHYGVACSISMYDRPLMRLSELQVRRLHADMQHLAVRRGEWEQPFYREQVGSLCQTLVYDFYGFHALVNKRRVMGEPQHLLVKRLVKLLESGTARTERSVAWYAEQLDVTSKVLGDIVLSGTGYTVSALIDRYAVALICEYLSNENLTAAQIAREMHFSSAAYFSRYAHKRLGMSVREYRAKMRR